MHERIRAAPLVALGYAGDWMIASGESSDSRIRAAKTLYSPPLFDPATARKGGDPGREMCLRANPKIQG